MDTNIPSKLYKYCKINEYTLENLKKDYFFLSRATNLNDSLEMMAYCSDDANIPNPEINNVNEYCEALKEVAFIGSLTTNYDNPALWANFTDNKGVCIEYDCSIFPNGRIHKVKYGDQKVDLKTDFQNMKQAKNERDYVNKANSNRLIEVFLRKAKAFEYEKEYRVIYLRDTVLEIGHTFEDRCLGIVPICGEETQKIFKIIGLCKTDIKPSKIYLGYSVSEGDKEKILEVCKCKNIKLYEAYHDDKDSDIKMKFKELNVLQYK